MSGKPIVTLEDVTLRVGGRWILPNTSWCVREAENWVIWGPNGSGKTTLAGALLGQVPVVAGFIHRHYRDNGSRRPAMALAASRQYHDALRRERLLDEMRAFSADGTSRTLAGEWLEANRLTRNAPPDADGPDPDAWLKLSALLKRPITALSSGEVRKLLLARALAANPQLLILDEPYNGLDAAASAELKQCLAAFMAAGSQIVLITHRGAEIPEGITHVLRLKSGRVVGQSSAPDFLRSLDAVKPSSRASDPDPPTGSPGPEQGRIQGAEPVIVFRNVKVRYGNNTILAGIDWQVNHGENWLLAGPNGAGKTTILQLITGDNLQGYANRISLFGRARGTGETLTQIRRHIGVVGDAVQAAYHRKNTGLEVVCSGFFDSIGLYRRCSPDQIEAAKRWLSRLELDHLKDARFDTLSDGQQRLILIARAMVKSPRLLICDEPCNGLDTDHRQRVLALLDRIARRPQTQLLYVSHRPDEKPACITHHLHLARGRVAAIGGPTSRQRCNPR